MGGPSVPPIRGNPDLTMAFYSLFADAVIKVVNLPMFRYDL